MAAAGRNAILTEMTRAIEYELILSSRLHCDFSIINVYILILIKIFMGLFFNPFAIQ